ncbi:type II secretion system protein GspL [Saccharospirillum impatiens]|uniref:type II secretion system protein GspL n=1 Tax=Saccharospirillum impatiens TaxID=169438 RepID=UPI0003FA8416|nr:type II secretion system protein GspL [Saccharospirillum impatiens]
MNVQISIFWQDPTHLRWRWSDSDEVREGRWDDVQLERQNQNLETVTTRLFLPHQGFTALQVSVPGGARRIPEAVLRFAAEEQLAQDIDSLHIVPLARPHQGSLPVVVIETQRLRDLQETLADGGFMLLQAFDAGYCQVSKPETQDVSIDVTPERVLCRAGWELHQIHPNGFSQWFDLWKRSQNLDEEAVHINLTSRSADDQGRTLKTELEAAGDNVNWQVQTETDLPGWDETVTETRYQGNLMTGPFALRKSSGHSTYWVPTALAAGFALAIWTGLTISQGWQDRAEAASTWEASETVFKQVFGQNKRIQQPLMVRELDNRIQALQQPDDAEGGSVLAAIDALGTLDAGLSLEDFRYQASRREMLFTVTRSGDTESDAFGVFEQLKRRLEQAGYTVEYSASQDRDAVRGRYRATREVQS